jgi:membrane protease YdiL (CAAX protease family)
VVGINAASLAKSCTGVITRCVAPLRLGLRSFAIALIGLTRYAVTRFGWAQRLHAELRPAARDLTLPQILALAGLSSLGEELLFRGLLAPTLGVIGSALLFGLAHQMKGPAAGSGPAGPPASAWPWR